MLELGQKAVDTSQGTVTPALMFSSRWGAAACRQPATREKPPGFQGCRLLCLPFSYPLQFSLLAIAAAGQSADETGLGPTPVSHFPVISLGYQRKDSNVFSGRCSDSQPQVCQGKRAILVCGVLSHTKAAQSSALGWETVSCCL